MNRSHMLTIVPLSHVGAGQPGGVHGAHLGMCSPQGAPGLYQQTRRQHARRQGPSQVHPHHPLPPRIAQTRRPCSDPLFLPRYVVTGVWRCCVWASLVRRWTCRRSPTCRTSCSSPLAASMRRPRQPPPTHSVRHTLHNPEPSLPHAIGIGFYLTSPLPPPQLSNSDLICSAHH